MENLIKYRIHSQMLLGIQDFDFTSGVAKGGQVGARALGRMPWGRTSTLFASI